jgi:N-dimethylarginine dimethylaminohydrolase
MSYQGRRVSVFSEWEPLREVVVGTPHNARLPAPDAIIREIDYSHLAPSDKIPSGPFSDRVIAETIEDLDVFVALLRSHDVVVQRPDAYDHGRMISNGFWQTDGQYSYCPRDIFIAVDDMLIEAPMTLRARYHESFAFKTLLFEYLRSGARWISAPRPILDDASYDLHRQFGIALSEVEPIFDAANVLRCGRDLIYLISDTGNEYGARWLQTILGDAFHVHTWRSPLYTSVHIDSTLCLLRPGLVLANPERVVPGELPTPIKNWDVIWSPPMVETGKVEAPLSTPWVGMNLFSIAPDMVVVESRQLPLIRALEAAGLTVIPVQLRHSRVLGGGFHCVTLDVCRTGECTSYR